MHQAALVILLLEWTPAERQALHEARVESLTARLRLVLAGSSGAWMPTFGSWERTVLEEAYEHVDEISLHAYYEEGDDLTSFLASAVAMDRHIEDVVAIADEVAAIEEAGADLRRAESDRPHHQGQRPDLRRDRRAVPA